MFAEETGNEPWLNTATLIPDLASSEIDARQFMLFGFFHQGPALYSRDGHVAAQQVRIIVTEHEDFSGANGARLLLAQTHLHLAVQHVVERHESTSSPDGRPTVLRYDLRAHTPGRAEGCFKKHSARKTHCAQQVR